MGWCPAPRVCWSYLSEFDACGETLSFSTSPEHWGMGKSSLGFFLTRFFLGKSAEYTRRCEKGQLSSRSPLIPARRRPHRKSRHAPQGSRSCLFFLRLLWRLSTVLCHFLVLRNSFPFSEKVISPTLPSIVFLADRGPSPRENSRISWQHRSRLGQDRFCILDSW